MRHTHHSNTPSLQIACAFGVNRKVSSFSINLSEGSVIQPHWKLTPFYEKFQKGGLPNEIKLTGVNNDGLVYMALHMNVELRAKSEVEVGIFFAAAPIQIEATSSLNNAKRQKNPIKVSESNWEEFFSGVPYFECSDEYLTRYYWYRWYGLRLMMIDGQEGHYKHPAVCEGIGDFRTSISYSAMCHMLETRWMHDPKVAQGSLLNFIENQREDGGFRGYIDVNYYRQEMFYHANWGIALRELYEIHPDDEFLMRVYDGLVKYVEYFDRKRDAEGSGLYDIDNHYETGQEYMHRYIVVNPNADKDNWGEVLQLKGVDVTVYLYELKRTLAWVGEKINRRVPRAHGVRTGAEIAEHRRGAEKIKQAILEKMWDPEEEMFFDIDPASGKRTMVKAATCFYPYMTDIVTEEHLNGLKKHLLNPKEFWTTYPVPSSSVDDEYFSPEAEWKGERMNCPWNGRVWPMTDSHIAEVLAQTAIRFNSKELREKSVEFIAKFIRMMFFDSDPQLPNCYEHYNPNTGKPSVFRGIDDYQHSWIVDLMLKYVAGIRVLENKLMVEPFPFRLRWLLIEDMVINGHRVKIHRQGKNFSVWVDDKHNVPSPGGYGIVTDIS